MPILLTNTKSGQNKAIWKCHKEDQRSSICLVLGLGFGKAILYKVACAHALVWKQIVYVVVHVQNFKKPSIKNESLVEVTSIHRASEMDLGQTGSTGRPRSRIAITGCSQCHVYTKPCGHVAMSNLETSDIHVGYFWSWIPVSTSVRCCKPFPDHCL